MYGQKVTKIMPLFRYTGCDIKVYRPENIDLVIKFQTCYPMSSSKLLFTGTQPSIMMMTKGSKLIRCRKSVPNAKTLQKIQIKSTITNDKQMVLSKRHMQPTFTNDNYYSN